MRCTLSSAGPDSRTPITRKRLLQRLAAAPPGGVVAIVGAAGMGKSTLVAQWVAEDERRILVPCHPGDNAESLARRLAVECGAIDEAPASTNGFRRRWVDVLDRALDRLADDSRSLVLDDCHYLTEDDGPALFDAVVRGWRSQGPVVLSSRCLQHVALGRPRSQRLLVAVGNGDLAFDEGEATAVIATSGRRLAASDVIAATGGWPVAVSAVIEESEPGLEPESVTERVSTRLAGLLAEDVLPNLAEQQRESLLLALALAPVPLRLIARLDDGDLHRRTIEDLLDFGLPLATSSIDRDIVVRVPDALAATLRRSVYFDPERASRAARSMSQLLESDGDLSGAFEYLLRAGVTEDLVAFVDRWAMEVAMGGRVWKLRDWLDRFDSPAVRSDPRIALAHTIAFSDGGDLRRLEGWLAAIEGTGSAAAGFDGNDAVTVARLAAAAYGLTDLKPGEVHGSGARACVALLVDAWTALADGDFEASQARLLRAEAGSQLGPMLEAHRLGALATVAALQAMWAPAERHVTDLVQLMERCELSTYSMLFSNHAVIARSCVQYGRAAEARRHAQIAERLANELATGAARRRYVSAILLSDTWRLLGETAEAARLLEVAAAAEGALTEINGQRPLLLQKLRRDPLRSSASSTLNEPLTTAEIRVLRLLATHLTVPLIAAELVIAPSTVRSHVLAIYRKLHVSARSDAVHMARVFGLIPPSAA